MRSKPTEMDPDDSSAIHYKRSHFVTRLPTQYLYSPSHYWLAEQDGLWRVGLTKFATRMLGEIVDYGFDSQPGSSVAAGQTVGWIEGFKAVSDLFCVVEGVFVSSNAHLAQNPEAIDRDCYGDGWLYCARGQPAPLCVDVQGYRAILDQTIDKLVEKQLPGE